MEKTFCRHCGSELFCKVEANFIIFCPNCKKEGSMMCEAGFGPVVPCGIYFGINKIGIITVNALQKYTLKLNTRKREIVLKETYLAALYEAIQIIESYIQKKEKRSYLLDFLLFRINNKDKENLQLREALSEFRTPLIKIKLLSEKLNYSGFTKRFEESLEILESNLDDQEKAKRILVKTEILGGMGTWNDSPPCTAFQMSISKEFEETTKQFSIARNKIKNI